VRAQKRRAVLVEVDPGVCARHDVEDIVAKIGQEERLRVAWSEKPGPLSTSLSEPLDHCKRHGTTNTEARYARVEFSVRARWAIAITVKGNGLIVRRCFAPCERCGENVADPKDADRWTTHLHARLKPFAHWTFRTLKLRTNANPANGCIDKLAGNSPNAAEGIAEVDNDEHPSP
jgi:hypothetical protein